MARLSVKVDAAVECVVYGVDGCVVCYGPV